MTSPAIDWLLASDDPGVRYLAMRDLLEMPHDDPQLAAARRLAHQRGPIADVLDAMQPEGYWAKPGAGYSPKYFSTAWALTLLAQLGAEIDEDERLARACSYLLEQALGPQGQFSYNGKPVTTITCLQGNLLAALLEMGCRDERLANAGEWTARSITGQGFAPIGDRSTPWRYSQYMVGPGFACAANDRLPCGWGAVKELLALSRLPADWASDWLAPAVRQGAEFLLENGPAEAGYPTPGGLPPNRAWWKFGFPVFYITDLLQLVEALARLGYAHDPRLQPAWEIIRGKQDAAGRWPLEYHYRGKTWIDAGPSRQPNPWVTIRALRALHVQRAVDEP